MQREQERGVWRVGRGAWGVARGTYLDRLGAAALRPLTIFRFIHSKASPPEQNQVGDQTVEEVDCGWIFLGLHKRGILGEVREAPGGG